MIRKILRKNKIKNANFFVEPDEIFLDSKNIGNFDNQQFEGRIEKPISKNTIYFFGFFVLVFILIFSFRLGYLQVSKGEAFLKRSENNTLAQEVIFADRGIIYDRNKVELAWNKNSSNVDTTEEDDNIPKSFLVRSYFSPGFSHILGYVTYPSKDKTGNYWQTEFMGKDGLEKVYSNNLKGINGSKLVETDVHGEIHSENVVNLPQRGENLITSLDSKVQQELFKSIEDLAKTNAYTGGAGIIIDIDKGEILASVSYPEYSSEILSQGKDKEKIKNYLTDKKKVFLDRSLSGLYSPGSIIKPFLALAALNEYLISPDKQILSTGSISIPNPYDKTKPTVFKDWKAHGWTDMREAIAVSSDVYFYTIGGGFEGQKGLGIANIEKYMRMFGVADKTGIDLPDEKSGVIPNPEWKLKKFKNDPWRIGDTYHTAIGQYGFQVTPIEMARATAALANGGTLVNPHFILGDSDKENNIVKLEFKSEDIKVVHEGMRQAVTSGTALALNVPYVKIAAKTGTAQIGILKDKINSWVIGFFPYDKPKYAFVVLMEAGPSNGAAGASTVMRRLVDYMYWETPEYFGLQKKEKPTVTPIENIEIIPATSSESSVPEI
ncbi:MAG: penicillin-binding transpeptidase domain-containing protein [bacterium]|nr:penicillin-binding transpeptidase domain-containing protein [bacterium]